MLCLVFEKSFSILPLWSLDLLLFGFFSWILNSSSLESWNQTSLDSWICSWFNHEIILWAFCQHLCHYQNFLNQLDSSSWSLLLHSKRRHVTYVVGDWVYVKLQPFCQPSLARTRFNKLSKRYYGPFHIIEAIGAVAYHLALPEDSKIHNVFYYSMLKPHQGPVATTTAPLPPYATDNHPLVEPLSVLDTKWDDTTSPPSLLALV